MLRNLFPALLLTLTTPLPLGCALEGNANLAPTQAELRWRLESRQELWLRSPASQVGLNARDRSGRDLECSTPQVIGGRTVLRSTPDGRLLVLALDAALSDITIEQGAQDAGTALTLTAVSLRLGTQLVLEPRWEADYATAIGTADLLMDWAVLADDGQVQPLATLLIRDAEFTVTVTLEQDVITAELESIMLGPLWDFTVLEVTDLSVSLRATAG